MDKNPRADADRNEAGQVGDDIFDNIGVTGSSHSREYDTTSTEYSYNRDNW